MTGLEVSTRSEGPIGVLVLMGEARVEGIPTLEEAVDRVRDQGAQSLLLDLTGLSFMDSASAGTLMRVSQELKTHDGRMVLYGVPRLISRMIDAAGLTAVFDVVPDEGAARSLLA